MPKPCRLQVSCVKTGTLVRFQPDRMVFCRPWAIFHRNGRGHTLDVSQNVYTRASVARRKEAVDALESALPVM